MAKKQDWTIKAVRPTGASLVVAACGVWALAASTAVQAGIDPFSITLSQRVTTDNNYLRNDANRVSDTLSVTSLGLGFNKSYGRQTYSARLTGSAQRNRTYTQYDNDGYSGSASIASTVGANSYLAASYSASRALQNPDEQTGVRINDKVTSRSASLFALHGVYSRLGLSANLSQSQTRYSLTTINDKDQVGGRLGVRFNPSDLISFDLGYRRSEVDLVNVAGAGNRINRGDIDLSTYWTVSGYSTLNGSLAYSQEKRPGVSGRDFKGLTGSVGWSFVPGGRLSYNVSVSRDTSNAGQGVNLDIERTNADGTKSSGTLNNLSQNLLSTTLNLGANYRFSTKLGFSANASYRRFKDALEGDLTGAVSASDVASLRASTANITTVSTGFNYAPIRNLSLGCNLEAFERTQSLKANGYRGEALGCTASFLMD